MEPDIVKAVLADGEGKGDAGPAFGAEGAGGGLVVGRRWGGWGWRWTYFVAVEFEGRESRVNGVSEVKAETTENGSSGMQATVYNSVNNSSRGRKSMPFVGRASMTTSSLCYRI